MKIFENISKVFKNLTKPKIQEVLLSAYQTQSTVFELINELKKEDVCGQLTFSGSSNITFYDCPNIYEMREEDLSYELTQANPRYF